jgi:hypothetical protein
MIGRSVGASDMIGRSIGASDMIGRSIARSGSGGARHTAGRVRLGVVDRILN